MGMGVGVVVREAVVMEWEGVADGVGEPETSWSVRYLLDWWDWSGYWCWYWYSRAVEKEGRVGFLEVDVGVGESPGMGYSSEGEWAADLGQMVGYMGKA